MQYPGYQRNAQEWENVVAKVVLLCKAKKGVEIDFAQVLGLKANIYLYQIRLEEEEEWEGKCLYMNYAETQDIRQKRKKKSYPL